MDMRATDTRTAAAHERWLRRDPRRMGTGLRGRPGAVRHQRASAPARRHRGTLALARASQGGTHAIPGVCWGQNDQSRQRTRWWRPRRLSWWMSVCSRPGRCASRWGPSPPSGDRLAPGHRRDVLRRFALVHLRGLPAVRRDGQRRARPRISRAAPALATGLVGTRHRLAGRSVSWSGRSSSTSARSRR